MSTDSSHFKEILQDKQKELLTRIEAIKVDFSAGRSADFAEQTTERENDDVLKNLVYEANVELRLVNDALQRIGQGNFGICEKCADEISNERLTAIPYAKYCRNCAE